MDITCSYVLSHSCHMIFDQRRQCNLGKRLAKSVRVPGTLCAHTHTSSHVSYGWDVSASVGKATSASSGSRLDVWSLGTVLYELLSLRLGPLDPVPISLSLCELVPDVRHPFQSSNMAATVLKIISSEPAPLPARCSEEAPHELRP